MAANAICAAKGNELYGNVLAVAYIICSSDTMVASAVVTDDWDAVVVVVVVGCFDMDVLADVDLPLHHDVGKEEVKDDDGGTVDGTLPQDVPVVVEERVE